MKEMNLSGTTRKACFACTAFNSGFSKVVRNASVSSGYINKDKEAR